MKKIETGCWPVEFAISEALIGVGISIEPYLIEVTCDDRKECRHYLEACGGCWPDANKDDLCNGYTLELDEDKIMEFANSNGIKWEIVGGDDCSVNVYLPDNIMNI